MSKRKGCKSGEIRIGNKCYSRNSFATPIKAKCANCGRDAWIMPFPEPNGMCLCSNCTFGEEDMSLVDMLKEIFKEN